MTAVGLLAGTAVDALLGDPRRGHPVAVFGRGAAVLETRVYANSRARGAVFTATAVGGAVVVGCLLDRLPGRVTAVAVATWATWAVLGGTTLGREALVLQARLDTGDLDGARARLPHLCGRSPDGLPAAELARAGVESVAENTSDAVVAPLFWGALFGVPGLLGYRAVNTLDAMVGHHSARYERFGWAVARLDDVANLVPARLTALLVAGLSGRDGHRVLATVRRDARRHPSPNSGWCEAAFAGALGLQLGGRNVYASRVEERPLLGDGRPARAADLGTAARLSRRVGAVAALLAAAGALAPRRCQDG